jgi:serine/threonine-protein kinase
VPPSFGAYRVLHQIGSGVLGPVFRTYEPQRDRLVAVKAFKLDLVPEDVARLGEALRRLVAAGLTQPGIVPVLDGGLEGTTAFLAMEYIAGETLDIAFRHLAPAPLARALPILSTMATAIDTAAAAGFGHGALHPRDVFFRSGSDDVLITGFGVVPALETLGFRPPARRPYAAPERIAGAPADLRADVYSLGAIAHELLTRRRPAGPGEQDGELSSGLSPESRALVRRVLATALAARPDERFQSATAFVEALSGAVHGEDAAMETSPLFEQLEDRPVRTVQEVQQVPQAQGVARVQEAQVNQPAQSVQPAEVHDDKTPAKPLPKVDAPPPADVRAERPSVARDRRPLPPALFASIASESEAPPPYPWVAMVAVGAACITLGGVIGYEVGIRRPAPPIVAGAQPASVRTDTDVGVPPAPAPPVAGTTGDPAASPAAAVLPPTSDAATPSGAAPRAAVVGRLSVHSQPSGAALTVNGRAHGTTPQTLRDLPLGSVTVEVTRRGYAPKSQTVTLTAVSPSADVTLTLTPRGASPTAKTASAAAKSAPAKTGSVYVDTRPPDARVTIDGKASGTTPIRVSGLSVGLHSVRVELAGYKPVTRNVTIKTGIEARVTLSLEHSGGTLGRPTTGRK